MARVDEFGNVIDDEGQILRETNPIARSLSGITGEAGSPFAPPPLRREAPALPPRQEPPPPSTLPDSPVDPFPEEEAPPELKERLSLVERERDLRLEENEFLRAEQEKIAALRAQQEEDRKRAQADQITAQKAVEAEYAESLEAFRNTKIDPGRLWKNASTPTKIAGVIGLAMGAIAEAGPIGKNSALQIINKAIDDDIAAQRAEMDKGQAVAQKKQNLLQITTQNLKDREAAEQQTRAMLLDHTIRQVQATMTAKFADKRTNLAMDQLRQGLTGEYAKAEAASIAARRKQLLDEADQISEVGKREQETALLAVKTAKEEKDLAGIGQGGIRPLSAEAQAAGFVPELRDPKLYAKTFPGLKIENHVASGDDPRAGQVFTTSIGPDGKPKQYIGMPTTSEANQKAARQLLTATDAKLHDVRAILARGLERAFQFSLKAQLNNQSLERILLTESGLVQGNISDNEWKILRKTILDVDPNSVRLLRSSPAKRRALLQEFERLAIANTTRDLQAFSRPGAFTIKYVPPPSTAFEPGTGEDVSAKSVSPEAMVAEVKGANTPEDLAISLRKLSENITTESSPRGGIEGGDPDPQNALGRSAVAFNEAKLALRRLERDVAEKRLAAEQQKNPAQRRQALNDVLERELALDAARIKVEEIEKKRAALSRGEPPPRSTSEPTSPPVNFRDLPAD